MQSTDCLAITRDSEQIHQLVREHMGLIGRDYTQVGDGEGRLSTLEEDSMDMTGQNSLEQTSLGQASLVSTSTDDRDKETRLISLN